MKTLSEYPAAVQERHQAARFARFKLEPINRNVWKIGQCPNAYEDTARKAMERKHFKLAARMFHLASCVSLGHSRAERYEDAAAECLRLAAAK